MNRSTTNILVRGELGRHSLQEQIVIRNINFIKYVENKSPHTLVSQAANYELLHINNRNSLYSIITKYKKNHSNNIRLFNKSKLRKLIREEFDTEWKSNIHTFPKADTYKLFKSRVKFESYLTDIKNRKHRITFSKYRLSDSCLKIETGRHTRPKIPREARYCPFCPDSVENEIHFLTQCTAYTNRHELFHTIEIEVPQFSRLNSEEQFKYLMSQENKLLNHKIISTVYSWFTARLELINS